MGNLKATFIINLKRERRKRGMTQAELAEKADLSTGFIGDIERGRANPSLQNVEILAQVLEIEPFMLFIPNTLQKSFNQLHMNTIVEEVREVLERYSDRESPE